MEKERDRMEAEKLSREYAHEKVKESLLTLIEETKEANNSF